MKELIFGVSLALFPVLIFIVVAFCIVDDRPCLKYEKQLVVTYPNMSYMALGPSYTGIALMPVIEEMDVCVEREEKK